MFACRTFGESGSSGVVLPSFCKRKCQEFLRGFAKFFRAKLPSLICFIIVIRMGWSAMLLFI